MTLPYERINALKRTQEFLRDLLDPSKTPRIPLKVRREAGACLRHYPSKLDWERWDKYDKIEWVKSEIAYERAPGIHTYQQCQCGNSTRSGKCFACLEKDLAVLEGRAKRDAQVQVVFDQIVDAVSETAIHVCDNNLKAHNGTRK